MHTAEWIFNTKREMYSVVFVYVMCVFSFPIAYILEFFLNNFKCLHWTLL